MNNKRRDSGALLWRGRASATEAGGHKKGRETGGSDQRRRKPNGMQSSQGKLAFGHVR